MEEVVLTRVPAKRAQEVVKAFSLDLEPEASKLVHDDQTPAQFLRVLIEQSHWLDAVRFLAHALPKRESVAWACVCARSALPSYPDSKQLGALEAAENWVKDPSEETRRGANTAAEAASISGPSSFAAMGAFLSGGSVAAPDVDEVAPSENLTGTMVAGAVIIAAYGGAASQVDDRFRRFMAKGIEIARGVPGKPR